MRRVWPACLVLVAALGLSGCGASPPSPDASGRASATPPTDATPPASSPVAVDPGLLDVLPLIAAGAERRADPESAADVVASGGLDRSAQAIALALYLTGDDYAVASVVQPLPGVATEAWFRSWRDDFDAGVCEQAGGVDPGHSEFELAGRVVHRSTCTGGVIIYHLRLEDPERIVSIQGGGEADLPRAIIEGLTE